MPDKNILEHTHTAKSVRNSFALFAYEPGLRNQDSPQAHRRPYRESSTLPALARDHMARIKYAVVTQGSSWKVHCCLAEVQQSKKHVATTQTVCEYVSNLYLR